MQKQEIEMKHRKMTGTKAIASMLGNSFPKQILFKNFFRIGSFKDKKLIAQCQFCKRFIKGIGFNPAKFIWHLKVCKCWMYFGKTFEKKGKERNFIKLYWILHKFGNFFFFRSTKVSTKRTEVKLNKPNIAIKSHELRVTIPQIVQAKVIWIHWANWTHRTMNDEHWMMKNAKWIFYWKNISKLHQKIKMSWSLCADFVQYIVCWKRIIGTQLHSRDIWKYVLNIKFVLLLIIRSVLQNITN